MAESYQIRYLAREIRSFKTVYPNLRYHITSGDTEQVTEKSDKGLLDFAVICERITAADLAELPLFCSEQSWENDIRPWAKEQFVRFRLEGSFRLAYNGSMFAREGLGILLTLNNLIDTSPDSGLTFRPLSPQLEMKMYLIWNRYQRFTPIAERFLRQFQASFVSQE